jgi:hypothetical protein
MPKLLVKSSQCASRLRSKWHITRPSGRNFIQIIIWISLCSMWQIQRPSGRNFIQIIIRISLCSMWYAIYVSSSTSKFDLLKSNEEATKGLENTCAMTSGLASRAERRPLLSKWQTVRVSSSVVENTWLLTRRNDIRLRISTTLDVTRTERNVARYSRSDKQSVSVRA